VFVENLHATRRLETTYYVTDVKQQTDFFWYREQSGVRVNIGVHNVNVVPLYEDVDHDAADNSFVTGSPRSDHDKAWFERVTRKHCRCARRASLPIRYVPPKHTANERLPKIITNNTKIHFLNCSQRNLVISNHNCFRLLFDKIASVYFS